MQRAGAIAKVRRRVTPAHDDRQERLLSRLAPLILLVAGAAMLLPRLGRFGLWDPTEVRVADAARSVVEAAGHPSPLPQPLAVLLVAQGFRALGVGELGGRLPLALVSLLALLFTYYAGRAVMRPRAALVGALALLTMPSFLLGARQLTSGAPALLGLVLALGGLAHAAWPPAGRGPAARLFAVVVAGAGLALGVRASGLLVGAVVPLGAIGVALAATGRARLRSLALGAASVALAGWACLLWRKTGMYSAILGGIPRPPQYQTVVTSLLHQLGFAAAPWLAIVPFSLLRALDGTQRPREDDDDARATFSRVLLPAALALLYLGATIQAAAVAELVVPAGAILALLCGAYLGDLLDAPELRVLEGVAIAVLAVIFGHDVMLTTDAFVSVQSTEQVRWPTQLFATGNVLFGLLSGFGALVLGALALPAFLLGSDRAAEAGPEGAPAPPTVRARAALLAAAIGLQLVFAVVLVQWLLPAASKHLSPKDLYGRTKQLDPKAAVGQYHFNAIGASYYLGGRVATQLGTLDDVLAFLRRPERVFVFAGSEELASIDQATRGAQAGQIQPAPEPPPPAPYFVIDDSNSRFLILSNRMGPNEADANPLKRFVGTTPPAVPFPLQVNFEDKLQLLGYDLPAEARRGEDVRVRLFFKVLAPVGGSYKVFLHFDGPGTRVNGDHVPLDGRFPTQYWTAGTYVTDEHFLKPDRATQPSGVFQLYFGLFAGDRRLKVKDGPSDGENRVRLGTTRIK